MQRNTFSIKPYVGSYVYIIIIISVACKHDDLIELNLFIDRDVKICDQKP